MRNIKISIIIAAFNEEKYIERCLRSCINQSMDKNEYEIIVVNDGSTDKTAYILDNYRKDIVILNLGKNMGLPTAVNKGILSSASQFIVRVDADDYVHEEFLRVGYLFLSMNKDFDSVAFDYLEVSEKEKITKRVNSIDRPIACGIVYRKDHLIDIGLYDPDFLLLEDEEFKIRYEKKYKITSIPLPLYRYRKHKQNMTNNVDNINHYRQMLGNKHKGK